MYRDCLGGTGVFSFQTFGVSPKTSARSRAEQQRKNTFYRPVCLALSGSLDSSQDMNEFKFASATYASVARGLSQSLVQNHGIDRNGRLASLSLRSQTHFARPMEHIRASGKAFTGWISQPN